MSLRNSPQMECFQLDPTVTIEKSRQAEPGANTEAQSPTEKQNQREKINKAKKQAPDRGLGGVPAGGINCSNHCLNQLLNPVLNQLQNQAQQGSPPNAVKAASLLK